MSTLISRNGFFPSVSFFDDFMTRDLFDWSNWHNGNNTTVPRVNIVETNDDFRVEMAAPGMKKDDFHVELDNDVLTISSEVQHEQNNEEKNYTRREFSYQSFRRSFHLPNTVEADKIEATYKDGLLSLVIPKKEEAKKKPVKQIAIA